MKSSILCLLETGKSQREVARILNAAQSSVNYIWKRFLETGNIKDRPKVGRPSKASTKYRRKLCRISMTHPNLTAKEVYNESNLNVYIRTVRSYLNKGGLFGKIAARKQVLSNVYIAKRLLWCKQYSAWTDDDWNKILFSDENRVAMISSRRVYIRRKLGQRYKNIKICKTLRFGGSSIMVSKS